MKNIDFDNILINRLLESIKSVITSISDPKNSQDVETPPLAGLNNTIDPEGDSESGTPS